MKTGWMEEEGRDADGRGSAGAGLVVRGEKSTCTKEALAEATLLSKKAWVSSWGATFVLVFYFSSVMKLLY